MYVCVFIYVCVFVFVYACVNTILLVDNKSGETN